jgi:outer membrane protein TolC
MRLLKLLFTAGLAAVGCSRAYYRTDADRETYSILANRALAPGSDIGRLRLEPGPVSRLADPFDPDHPPKPPDDPAAQMLMSHPYRFRGYSHWGRYGYTDEIEGPNWLRALPLGPDGVLTLDSRTSAEVALVNSREYQTNLEGVYQTALSLTLNRFDLDVHWLGTNATNYTHTGTGGFPVETNTLTSTNTAGFTQNLAAGGQIVAEFINSLAYTYSGGTNQLGSNIFLGITQPLIRGFGRDIELESLTEAERTTLYAVRTFARYRKSFYVGITAGRTSGIGYLGLLLQLQQLRNSEADLKRQEESYRLYDELFRGGRASVVDVDIIYQGLLNSRLSVINSQLALENSLDTFKLQLGLPPRLPVKLDDSPLQLFILTDPATDKLRDELETFQRARLSELDAPPSTDVLRKAFTALRGLADRVPDAAKSAIADLETFRLVLARPASPTDDAEQRQRDAATYKTLVATLNEASEDMTRTVARMDADALTVAEGKRKENWTAVTEGAKRVLAILDTVIAVQTQSRIYTIQLPEAGGDEAPLVAFAKANRLDLQNQLAQATDAWRNVTVSANALQTGLSINGSVNLASDPAHQNPFKFDAHGNTYTAGVQIDTPLNRQAERNAYRLSLITYQQAKRAYVALSDQIEQQVRQDLRQLRQLRASFGIARQQLLAAARQYENTRLSLVGPQDQQRGGGGGTDTATLQLQTALTNLLNARNALAAAYINFEQQRLQFLLDLEELQLDPRGFPTNGAPRYPGPAGPAGPARGPDGGNGPGNPGREGGNGPRNPGPVNAGVQAPGPSRSVNPPAP